MPPGQDRQKQAWLRVGFTASPVPTATAVLIHAVGAGGISGAFGMSYGNGTSLNDTFTGTRTGVAGAR